MNLGENIYRFRTEQNMSQGDLANALDVSRQSVSKWENNTSTPDLDKLIKMSEFFQVTLDELVGHSPAPTPTTETQPVQSGLTVADMISILLLLFGILIPVVILATSRSHNSPLLMVLALFIIPPLATICAALSTPKKQAPVLGIYRL